MTLRVHKIALKPNNKQETYFKKASGVARFSYNWALGEWKKQYENGGKPTESQLRKQLNAIKQTEFPWMQEVTKVAPQQAIKNLGQAFDRFFKNLGKYPNFKKKGIRDSFRADNGPATKSANAVNIKNKKIQLPKIGWVRLEEEVRFLGQIKSVTISRRANRWFAAIAIETTTPIHVRKNHATVGVDLGIKTFAQISTGESYNSIKPYVTATKKVRRLSKDLSRKQKKSQNFLKAKKRLAKQHAKVASIRNDYLHKITTELTLNYSCICIEDLHVKGLSKNRKLAKHILDQSFAEFRRQLEYKAELYNAKIIVAPRFYPSSKMCSCCSSINQNLTLSIRNWTCENCNTTHDRDLNAAINLAQYGRSTASSAGI